MSEALSILRDPEAAGAALHPVRRRVLHALREPGSATTVGAALGLSRQKVNYHLRALEAAGLVEHVEDRRKGNCTERIVRATASHYLVDPAVLGAPGKGPTEVADQRSSDQLAAISARTVSELAELRARAAEAGKRVPTFSLETAVRFSSPGDQAAFTERLANALAELVHDYHDESAEGGRWFRFFVGAHPSLTAGDELPDPAPERS